MTTRTTVAQHARCFSWQARIGPASARAVSSSASRDAVTARNKRASRASPDTRRRRKFWKSRAAFCLFGAQFSLSLGRSAYDFDDHQSERSLIDIARFYRDWLLVGSTPSLVNVFINLRWGRREVKVIILSLFLVSLDIRGGFFLDDVGVILFNMRTFLLLLLVLYTAYIKLMIMIHDGYFVEKIIS